MQARPVADSRVMMTEMVLPQHTNAQGSAFGGVIMSWIDICAAIAAQRHSCLPCVTASVDALQFVAPVRLGWVVTLQASVNYTGKSSMEIGVRIDSEDPYTREKFHTASAYLTFVALGENKKPVSVAPILAQTADEKRRQKAAQFRRDQRLALRELIKA